MRNKKYWGIATLVILLGIFGVFLLFIKDRAEIRQLEKELAESNKLLEEQNKEKTEQPPLARDGFKMVKHGDHWHEVPIDAPDVWQEGTPEPVVQNDTVQVFDAALLKDDPAALLNDPEAYENARMIARRHPPFETYAHLLDDPEATLRKNAKIIVENYGTPEAEKAYAELNLLHLAIDKGYLGGSMWSPEARKLRQLEKEVLSKPLEEMGLVVSAPVPIVEVVSTPQEGEKP